MLVARCFLGLLVDFQIVSLEYMVSAIILAKMLCLAKNVLAYIMIQVFLIKFYVLYL
jgi:hypothetical protein